MATFFKDYDAVASFKSLHTDIYRKLKNAEGKPRSEQRYKDEIYFVNRLFSEFINRELAHKYPGQNVKYFDLCDSVTVLENLNGGKNSTIKTVFDMFEFSTTMVMGEEAIVYVIKTS